MSTGFNLRAHLSAALAPVLLGLVFLATSGIAFAGPCTGPGAPSNAQTRCVTAIAIVGNPLTSFDISWADPGRAEYYLGDRSNAGIDIIDTEHKTFKRRLPGFVGIVLNKAGTAVDNNHSGPDGVT